METQSKDFLATWVLACIVLAAVVAVFDAIVDPYLLFDSPRIAGFNARKPAADTRQRLMKAYEVLRAKPNTLILGSSRVDLGLDAQDPAWPARDRPVYNLGLAGGTPYIEYRYLQHVLSQRHVALVVLGLEFEYFLTFKDPVEPEDESRLAINRDGSANSGQSRQHIRDLFHAVLSLDALTDSAVTLAANFNAESSDLVAGNWEWSLYRRTSVRAGSYPLVLASNLDDIDWYRRPKNPLVMSDVRAILDLCESHGTRVILFISPSRADELEILDRAGHWQEFESWKRELVALTAKYADTNGRSRIPLWDFSGYDVYSTETVPAGRHVLHWFWESMHYNRALGDLIVRRIFGTGRTDFGVLLSPDGVEQQLAAIREQQRLYRAHHSEDARRVRELYDSLAGVQFRVVAKDQE